MSDTESFLIVDDLIGLNEKIDLEKLKKSQMTTDKQILIAKKME